MAFADREGGGWRSLCQSLPRRLGQLGAQIPPFPPPHASPGVPSPPAPLPGLPDEAFESLTQLQHIYVAHNKVSHQPNPSTRPKPGPTRVTQHRVQKGWHRV